MLADHGLRFRRRRSPVVVGDGLARGDEQITDPRLDLGIDLAEPPGCDRLRSSDDPGTFGLCATPTLGDRLPSTRSEAGLEMELKATRFSGNVPNTFEEGGVLVDEHMRARGNIDDAVVGGHQHAVTGAPGTRPQRRREIPHGGIDDFEALSPFDRLPPERVRGLVELRDVEVEQSGWAGFTHPVRRTLEAVSDGCGCPVFDAAQHRAAEAGIPVARRSNRDRAEPRIDRALEHGR